MNDDDGSDDNDDTDAQQLKRVLEVSKYSAFESSSEHAPVLEIPSLAPQGLIFWNF